MQAWVPSGAGDLRLEERAEPDPEPDELSVRVDVCAVCRTDLHLVAGELAPRRPGVTPGHQAVGVSGQGVKHPSRGPGPGIRRRRLDVRGHPGGMGRRRGSRHLPGADQPQRQTGDEAVLRRPAQRGRRSRALVDTDDDGVPGRGGWCGRCATSSVVSITSGTATVCRASRGSSDVRAALQGPWSLGRRECAVDAQGVRHQVHRTRRTP